MPKQHQTPTEVHIPSSSSVTLDPSWSNDYRARRCVRSITAFPSGLECRWNLIIRKGMQKSRLEVIKFYTEGIYHCGIANAWLWPTGISTYEFAVKCDVVKRFCEVMTAWIFSLLKPLCAVGLYQWRWLSVWWYCGWAVLLAWMYGLQITVLCPRRSTH